MSLLALSVAGALLTAAVIAGPAVGLSKLPAMVTLAVAVAAAAAWNNRLARHDAS